MSRVKIPTIIWNMFRSFYTFMESSCKMLFSLSAIIVRPKGHCLISKPNHQNRSNTFELSLTLASSCASTAKLELTKCLQTLVLICIPSGRARATTSYTIAIYFFCYHYLEKSKFGDLIPGKCAAAVFLDLSENTKPLCINHNVTAGLCLPVTPIRREWTRAEKYVVLFCLGYIHLKRRFCGFQC